MKQCSLQDFMEELRPWLDRDHIHGAVLDSKGHLVIRFLDGTKNVYLIDDCNSVQVQQVLNDLKARGIAVDYEQ